MTQTTRRVALTIWVALAGGVAIFLGVALAMPQRADPDVAPVLLPAALLLAATAVALSLVLPRRIRPRGAATPDALALARTVVASALCEGAALFAVVGLMVTGDATFLVALALAAAGLLRHFPGEQRWARLREDGAPAGQGAGRMMRE